MNLRARGNPTWSRGGGSQGWNPETEPAAKGWSWQFRQMGLRLPAQPGTAAKSFLVLVRLNPDGQGGVRTTFLPGSTHHQPPGLSGLQQKPVPPKGLGQSKARGTALLQPEVRAQLSPKPRAPCQSNWAEDASLSSSGSWEDTGLGFSQNSRMSENRKGEEAEVGGRGEAGRGRGEGGTRF